MLLGDTEFVEQGHNSFSADMGQLPIYLVALQKSSRLNLPGLYMIHFGIASDVASSPLFLFCAQRGSREQDTCIHQKAGICYS